MSIPTSVEAITVIVLFLIPGYVFLQFTKRAVAFVPQSVDARYFFAVITWGGLTHGLALYWTFPLINWYQDGTLRDHHSLYIVIWAGMTLVIGPLLAGVVGAWLIQLGPVNKALGLIAMDYVSRTPSAWNFATKLGPLWVRVHLKDGTVIGGVFEDGSFADDTDERDIYLERVYNLTQTGDFGKQVRNNAGVWIARDTISHVMFFKVEANGGSDGEETSTASTTEA